MAFFTITPAALVTLTRTKVLMFVPQDEHFHQREDCPQYTRDVFVMKFHDQLVIFKLSANEAEGLAVDPPS